MAGLIRGVAECWFPNVAFLSQINTGLRAGFSLGFWMTRPCGDARAKKPAEGG